NTSGVSPGPLREASSPEVNHLSVSTAGPSLLDLLSAQVASLSARLDVIESQRARLTQLEASTSASLTLTPPDVLLSTSSAALVNTSQVGLDSWEVSSATISGLLTSYEGIFQNSLKSLGETYLGNTTIAGNFSIDGTMNITGSSLSTLGTLYLQNGPLAGNVDFFNNLITIDNKGNIIAQGEVTTTKINLTKTVGTGLLPAGQRKIIIYTKEITENSLVFITPTTITDQILSVTSQIPGYGFTVEVKTPSITNIQFNWWIVN
ncbi:MAG: hypothetical protein UU73_C0007G0001, partial [Candidatus Daviesbacteria bacterium GW2011_GWA1_41_61]